MHTEATNKPKRRMRSMTVRQRVFEKAFEPGTAAVCLTGVS